MLPSESTLLEKIRNELARAQSGTAAALNVAALKLAVDELLLRRDSEFIASFRSRGTALVGEGMALLGLTVPAASGIDEIFQALSALMRRASNVEGSPTVRDYVARIVDWENSLYRARAQRFAQAGPNASALEARFTLPALQTYLQARFESNSPPIIRDLRVLGGGFSKITVLIDIDNGSGSLESLVIRAEPPVKLISHEGAEIENEYWFLKYAHQLALLVPEPLWLETDTRHFGIKFLVTRKAPGRNIGSAIDVREQVSDGLLLDLVRHLARIHSAPIDLTNEYVQRCHLKRGAADKTIHDSIGTNIAFWREQTIALGLPASPLLDRALSWLEHNVPDCDDPPHLIHRDYGTHNILIDGDRVSAILDWESAIIGDPAEDLSWVISCMKGAIDQRRILATYEQVSGRKLSEQRLRYFDVANAMKFAVTCSQALMLLERYPQTPIDACQLGLLFMHHGTGELNHNIALAEAAKRSKS